MDIRRVAALLYAVMAAGVVAFQIALAAGAPWGAYAMAGAFPGQFPPALRIAALDDGLLKVVSMKSLKRPAPRPVDSRLECLLSKAIGLRELPAWEDALRRFIEESAAEQRTSPVAHISN